MLKVFVCAQTLTSAENAVSEAVSQAVTRSQDPARTQPLASITEAAAIAIGTITVEAYAASSVDLTVQGSGFAAGFAEARAEDIDQAVASAVAFSLSEASDGIGLASSSAIAESLVVAFAEARASSVARARTFQGDAVAFQQSTAKIVARPVAVAIANTIAVIMGGKRT